MNIILFEINSEKTAIDVVISNADNVSSLRLWKETNFKDYNLAIDLSSKLGGSTIETFEITLEDLGETFFDGIYFLEAEDNTSISLKITADLTKYEECILEKVITANLNNQCLVESNLNVINAHSILTSLKYSIALNFVNEILKLNSMLKVYCSNDCKTCGDYKNSDSFTNSSGINLNGSGEGGSASGPVIIKG